MLSVFLPPRLGSSFRWLLASSWTTNFGDGIAIAAGPLLVASLTRDPFLISLAALLSWAPPLAFGLFAGVLSDRHDRRRIVMIADGSRAVVLAVVVAALATGHLTATGALLTDDRVPALGTGRERHQVPFELGVLEQRGPGDLGGVVRSCAGRIGARARSAARARGGRAARRGLRPARGR